MEYNHDESNLQEAKIKTDQDTSDEEEHLARQPIPPSSGLQNDGAAENLIRGEARAVRFLRGALILLLVTAATVTGIFVHKLAAKNKMDAFTSDFEDVANQFIRTFKGGIANQLYYAYTLSYAMGTGLYSGSKPDFPYVSVEALDNQAYTLNLQTRGQDIIWSPLLTSHTERQKWETYAESSQQNSAEYAGQYPPCNVCGEGFEIAYPDNLVSFSGVQGTFQCYVIAQDGKAGLISASNCLDIQPMVKQSCGCNKADGSEVEPDGDKWLIKDGIFRLENGTAVRDDGPLPFSPVWQISPSAAGRDTVMFNQMSVPIRRNAINTMVKNKVPVLSKTINPSTDPFHQLMKARASPLGILAVLFFPVFELSTSKVVGSLAVDFSWKLLFELDVTPRCEGTDIVLENSCGQVYSFKAAVDGIVFLGEGDLHDSSFDALAKQSTFEEFEQLIVSVAPNSQGESSDWGCAYRIRVYPSNEMRKRYLTGGPWVATVIVVSIFIFTSSVFLLYDFIVRRLQDKVLNSAKLSEAIVSSLFPAVVRDRLYNYGHRSRSVGQETLQVPAPGSLRQTQKRSAYGLMNPKELLRSYLSHPPSVDVSRESEPIADLFPNTTVLFADIAGFTAWSSEREPSQVFKLLETLYGAFDQVANRLGVFKVETIGDCYVAASGLPEPRIDHAVIMVKFASECLTLIHKLTRSLESTLGPGTADLSIRVGLHSGPVTAGVLRAERARFQLFGDTMNTASRMESNGKVNQIHVSKETAQLLVEAGKSNWIEQRNELITVKGKGEMQTYWIKPKAKNSASSTPDGSISCENPDASSFEGTVSVATEPPRLTLDNRGRLIGWNAAISQKSLQSNAESVLPWKSSNNRDQLIEWNTTLLQQFLQKVVAKRFACAKRRTRNRPERISEPTLQEGLPIHIVKEITEVIKMPDYNDRAVKEELDATIVELSPAVRSQLHDYVARIAELYRDNAFHNFEHASHVVMSASKLLKRIIAPDDVEYRAKSSRKMKSRKILFQEIHKATFGISSDPLMQFAVVFSALIHDVDHTGLQNRQLIQRKDPLALRSRGKCVAEQHSVRYAWQILMEDRYNEFRACIYQSDDERSRFRQLVVNAVIATDIADKELQKWRKSRWDKVFHDDNDGSLSPDDKIMTDRKATIVFEYIIQASDIAHTMQHWHIYKKWNQRLFHEQFTAYLQGEDEEDPSISWFQNELSFFDNYVIPLAKNLKECNVFGVSSDEFLTYALANRHEWELKGEQIVSEMVGLLRPGITAPAKSPSDKGERGHDDICWNPNLA